MSATPQDLDKQATAYTSEAAGREVMVQGRIVAHSLVPMVCIESSATGERIWWRHDMVEVED